MLIKDVLFLRRYTMTTERASFCSIRACVFTLALILVGCASTPPPVTATPQAVHIKKQTFTTTRDADLTRFEQNTATTFRIDVVKNGEDKGHGTGTVISTDGHLLTAYHVVNEEKAVFQIVIDDVGKSTPTIYPVKVIAFDKNDDIAVVKIERRFAATVVLEDVRNVRPGDRVYNIGYPYKLGVMIGRGYITKMHYTLRRTDGSDLSDVTLLDIPDGSGTSGSGVFVDTSGRLIGVMRVMFWMSSGNEPPLIAKAITPVDHIIPFLDKNHIPYVLSDAQ